MIFRNKLSTYWRAPIRIANVPTNVTTQAYVLDIYHNADS